MEGDIWSGGGWARCPKQLGHIWLPDIHPSLHDSLQPHMSAEMQRTRASSCTCLPARMRSPGTHRRGCLRPGVNRLPFFSYPWLQCHFTQPPLPWGWGSSSPLSHHDSVSRLEPSWALHRDGEQAWSQQERGGRARQDAPHSTFPRQGNLHESWGWV